MCADPKALFEPWAAVGFVWDCPSRHAHASHLAPALELPSSAYSFAIPRHCELASPPQDAAGAALLQLAEDQPDGPSANPDRDAVEYDAGAVPHVSHLCVPMVDVRQL